MTGMTNTATRVLLGVRGMSRDAGTTVAQALSAMPGVVKATPTRASWKSTTTPRN